MIAGRKRGHVTLSHQQGTAPINISYSPCSSSSKLSHKQMAVGMLTSFFYFNRFKDRNFNIVFATGCWIFASPSTWSSRCRQGKYKLQSSWPSFGMCLSSCAQFFILYSCMTSTEYFFTLHQKVYLALLKREVIICCKIKFGRFLLHREIFSFIIIISFAPLKL